MPDPLHNLREAIAAYDGAVGYYSPTEAIHAAISRAGGATDTKPGGATIITLADIQAEGPSFTDAARDWREEAGAMLVEAEALEREEAA